MVMSRALRVENVSPRVHRYGEQLGLCEEAIVGLYRPSWP
jgi:hypothetical protein